MDISNGEGVGVALFVQGCHFHCYNCFNPETWDFNGGKEWTDEVKNKFFELVDRPYIKRVSILGGEPLEEENIDGVLDLVNKIRLSSPHKSIWLYTGFSWNEIWDYGIHGTDLYGKPWKSYGMLQIQIQNIIKQCDVLVDGRYVDSQKDITLAYRGSKNQRLIDIQQSLQKGDVVLWEQKIN